MISPKGDWFLFDRAKMVKFSGVFCSSKGRNAAILGVKTLPKVEIFRFGEIPQWCWTPFWRNFAILGLDAVLVQCRSTGLFPFSVGGILSFGEILHVPASFLQNAWRNKTSRSFSVCRSFPSRRAMFRSAESGPFDTVSSRQQTTLQPNPTDRKPTLEAERQGLGCSEPGTFRPFRPRRSRRQHSKFRTFLEKFKPFRHFFCNFFCHWVEFSSRRLDCPAFLRTRAAGLFGVCMPFCGDCSPLSVCRRSFVCMPWDGSPLRGMSQPERKHRRRRDAGSGPLSRAARRR